MSFTSDLFTGMATAIADQSSAAFRATGTYLSTEIPIVHKTMPDRPDRCIAITFYPVDDGDFIGTDVLGMQVRERSAKGHPDCDTVLDEIFDALQNAAHFTANGIRINLVERNSSLPMGLDQNQRQERSDSYYLTLERPTTNRQ